MTLSKDSLGTRPISAPAPIYLRSRFAVLFLLSLMYFIAYIDRTNISVAAPLISKELGIDKTQLGLIFSIFAYPYTVMQITGGWLADRYGPRLVLFVLCVTPCAMPRSCGGNQKVMARVAVGNAPPSPRPTTMRTRISDKAPATAPVNRVAADQMTHSTKRTRRGP